jgi:hypothetical protein
MVDLLYISVSSYRIWESVCTVDEVFVLIDRCYSKTLDHIISIGPSHCVSIFDDLVKGADSGWNSGYLESPDCSGWKSRCWLTLGLRHFTSSSISLLANFNPCSLNPPVRTFTMILREQRVYICMAAKRESTSLKVDPLNRLLQRIFTTERTVIERLLHYDV